MSSTNKTSHYNLSQYSASDKPTYLVDYNTDMSNIDTGIYNAQTTANSLEANIGTLGDLTTTAKSSTVAAINEVNGKAGDNTTAIGSLQTATATNTSNIGTMANLSTADRSSLVNAINEVLTKLNSQPDMKLTSVTSYNVADYVTSGGMSTTGTITIARNADGSVAKIYGNFNDTSSSGAEIIITITNTGLTPTSEFTISDCGIGLSNVNNTYKYMRRPWIVCKTNGTVEVHSWPGVDNVNLGVILFNSIYFIKDFGDTPSPQ